MRRRDFIAALGSATRGGGWRARSRLAMPVIVESWIKPSNRNPKNRYQAKTKGVTPAIKKEKFT